MTIEAQLPPGFNLGAADAIFAHGRTLVFDNHHLCVSPPSLGAAGSAGPYRLETLLRADEDEQGVMSRPAPLPDGVMVVGYSLRGAEAVSAHLGGPPTPLRTRDGKRLQRVTMAPTVDARDGRCEVWLGSCDSDRGGARIHQFRYLPPDRGCLSVGAFQEVQSFALPQGHIVFGAIRRDLARRRNEHVFLSWWSPGPNSPRELWRHAVEEDGELVSEQTAMFSPHTQSTQRGLRLRYCDLDGVGEYELVPDRGATTAAAGGLAPLRRVEGAVAAGRIPVMVRANLANGFAEELIEPCLQGVENLAMPALDGRYALLSPTAAVDQSVFWSASRQPGLRRGAAAECVPPCDATVERQVGPVFHTRTGVASLYQDSARGAAARHAVAHLVYLDTIG
jgi:hypothetical protein